MIYGDEKALEMGRSLLPSTKRRSARWLKRNAHHIARSRERQSLQKALHCHDIEDWAFDEVGEGKRRRDINSMMRSRRDGDKIAPFQKWAKVVTSNLPQGDRLSWVRHLLPKNIISDHALGHLKYMDHFEHPRVRAIRENRYADKVYKSRTNEERAALLRGIVEDGRAHRELNDLMNSRHHTVRWVVKYQTGINLEPDNSQVWKLLGRIPRMVPVFKTEYKAVGPRRPRLLKGIGDIENFLTDIHHAQAYRGKIDTYVRRDIENTRFDGSGATYIVERPTYRENPEYHPEWWQTMEAFLDAWVKCSKDSRIVNKVVEPTSGDRFTHY